MRSLPISLDVLCAHIVNAKDGKSVFLCRLLRMETRYLFSIALYRLYIMLWALLYSSCVYCISTNVNRCVFHIYINTYTGDRQSACQCIRVYLYVLLSYGVCMYAKRKALFESVRSYRSEWKLGLELVRFYSHI